MLRLSLFVALPVVLCALLLPARAANSAYDPCRVTTAPPSSPVAVASDGDQRDALVHTPAGQKGVRPQALVLALHGSKGDGAFMERYSGFSTVADRNGFVVAYPSAAGPWSDFDPQDGARNVRYISALLDVVESRWCVDPARVFVVGISSGAGMAMRLACDLSDRVAGAAAVAGYYSGPCRPPRPVSIFEIYGDKDPITSVMGVKWFVSGWHGRDRCLQPSRRGRAPRAVEWTAACGRATSVRQLRILGGGHQYPGATPHDPGPADPVSASVEAWRFFSDKRIAAPW
jgi:polyhydroxybutyrate depolymerase